MSMTILTRPTGMAVSAALAAALLAAPLLAPAPGLAADAEFSLPVTEQTSPNGKVFWHLEAPTIPIVSVDISFEGGARLDPEGLAGVSRLTMGLLDEGAADRDAVAAAEAADALNARFGFSAGRDSVSVSAQMLAENLEASAALLNDRLTKPRFDPDAIERVRTQVLAGIAADETDPGAQASKAFYNRLFPEHPYGRPVSGTAESVGAITRDDLVAQRAKLMTLDRAHIAVVGAVDAERAGRIVDAMLTGLPKIAPEAAALPDDPEGVPPPGVVVVSLDIPQSVAVFGQQGIPRDDPDYIPAFVMNYILGGGGFSSRLMTEVREKRGLAYGVYSYLADIDGAPLYVGQVQTANERIGESLEVIRAEWARMAEEGVTEEELANAKQYLTGAFPLRFDSNGKISGFLVAAQQYELGLDYIAERNGLVDAVTVEDIGRVAARLLDADALSTVVVGQPAGL
ncbi:MAG: pitrilysin family protein [Pseudomonadota bacterium]